MYNVYVYVLLLTNFIAPNSSIFRMIIKNSKGSKTTFQQIWFSSKTSYSINVQTSISPSKKSISKSLSIWWNKIHITTHTCTCNTQYHLIVNAIVLERTVFGRRFGFILLCHVHVPEVESTVQQFNFKMWLVDFIMWLE